MKQRKGFTLIELLVTIGIIVLLAALVIPMVFRASRTAKSMQAEAFLQQINTAIIAWRSDHKNDVPYPLVPEDINALAQAVMSPAPDWYDGINGTGKKKNVTYSATGMVIRDKSPEFEGQNEKSGYIQCDVNQFIQRGSGDFRLQYQVSLADSERLPVIYAPIVNGIIPDGKTALQGGVAPGAMEVRPGYVSGDGTLTAYPRGWTIKNPLAAEHAKYVLVHPGPDGEFWKSGATNDDVYWYGQ